MPVTCPLCVLDVPTVSRKRPCRPLCRILTQPPAPKSNETRFAVQNRLTGRFCFLVDIIERNSMNLQLLTKPQCHLCAAARQTMDDEQQQDRKSTRLNSSHVAISYAVFCLKKKKNQ